MSDPYTIRILSFDGGGERGYLSLLWFKKFVKLWGIKPEDIALNFDVISGTSVGGIIGLALAFGKTPDELLPFFTEKGPYIFSLTSVTPSVRPNLAAKLALIVADIPFYQSSGPTANLYGSGLLASTLVNEFGPTTRMRDLKTNVIVPAYEMDTSTYVLFSNLNYPDYIGQNELVSNVALATAAAPIYLPPLIMNGHTYIDGGVYQNNPSSFGRSLAQSIKPISSGRCCLLSIGTGIGEKGFDPGNPDVVDPRVHTLAQDIQNKMSRSASPQAFNSIQTIFALFGIASVGGQESVAKNLFIESQYALTELYYYRFQPTLDPNLNTELDNTDPQILQYYSDVVEQEFYNDAENISIFLGHLIA